MDKKSIIKDLQASREQSKDRKFSQTFDMIISLKDLNLKNPEQQVEFFATLHHPLGRNRRVCAFVGPELADKAAEVCETTISVTEFAKYKDKKLLKQLAKTHDFFLAQADIMPKVAATFGRALGPRGKMPNPKAGQILPPKASVKPIYDNLQKMVKISAKKQLAIQVPVGKDVMKDEDVADNILDVYNQLIHQLPQEKNNIKDVLVKLTMSKPIKIN